MTSDVAHVRSMYRGAVAPGIVLGLLTGGYLIVAGIAGLAGWTALLRDDFFKFSLLRCAIQSGVCRGGSGDARLAAVESGS